MKLFVLLAVAVCSNAAKLNRNYLPPSFAQTSGGSDSFLETPRSTSFGSQGGRFNIGNINEQPNFAKSYTGFENNGFVRSERPQAAFERNAAILRQTNENDGEQYAYSYETENGIYAEEKGVATNGVRAEGGFSYIGDDGKQYSIRYTANENGFRPEGDHLPTPPPIPEEILKALEQNARDEAAGIYDDGSYNENKYNNNNGYGSNYYNQANNNAYGSNSYNTGNNNVHGSNNYNNYNQAGNDNDAVVINSAQPESRRYNAIGNNGYRRPANDFGYNAENIRSYLPPKF